MPAAAEWLANVDNPNTRRAYGSDVGEFMSMLGIPPLRRAPTRPPGPRHRLAEDARGARSRSGDPAAEALGRLLLFRYLCNENAVDENPVSGVRRPRMENANEGRTPALSDAQARRLLSAPEGESLLARRDRALLAVLLYHGLRRDRGRPPHGRIAPRAPGRAALQGHRQGPQDPDDPRPPGRPLGTGRLPRARRPPPRPERTPVPADPRPAGPAGRSPATASTSSSGSTPRPRPSPWSASSTRCGPPPPPTPSKTRPTSPASRTGSATPTSAPPASTTAATAGPRTAPRSGSATEGSEKAPPGRISLQQTYARKRGQILGLPDPP